jgi:hypothetical protein
MLALYFIHGFKALIHSILAVSTIIIILVTMTSVGQRVGAASAITSTKSADRTTTTNTNDINCQSKKGTANTETALGTLKFAGGKCTGENGGTVAAGGVKSNSGAIGIHGINVPNGNPHIWGIIKR